MKATTTRKAAGVYVLLAAFVMLFGAKAKAATLIPCAGAPADYVQAFTALDGSSGDGAVKYPYATWYDEKQTQVTREGVTPGAASEHIHIGSCFPNGVTFTDAMPWQRIDVGYTFYNSQDYKVTQAVRTAFNGVGAGKLYEATPTQVVALDAAMKASANNAVTKVFQSYPIIRQSKNGLKEVRGGIDVIEDGPGALFHTWKLDSTNFYTDNYAGLPLSVPDTKQFFIHERSIVQFPNTSGGFATDYHKSGWDEYGLTRADITRYWQNNQVVNLRVSDGGDEAMLEVDPNHHGTDFDGVWFKDLGLSGDWPLHPCGCARLLSVPVPTTGLSHGWHRLVFISHDFQTGRPSWTNVTVRPFYVN